MTQEQLEGYQSLTIYILQVNIQKAENLENADVIGKSDPFAVVTVNDQKYITKTIEDDLNPKWNEHTSFSFTAPLDKPLQVEVFDYDKGELGKHDSIGSGTLQVMDFFKPDSPGFDNWIKLENVKKGKVFLSIRGKIIKPYDLESRIETMTEITNKQQKDLDSQKERLQKVENEVDAKKQTSQELSTKITNLQEERDNLQKKLSNTEEETEKTRRVKAVTESEIRLTGEKIEDYLNNVMPDLGEKTMVKKNEFTEAKKKSENLRKQIADMKDNINEVERKCDKTRDDIRNVSNGVQSYVWNEESRSSKSPSKEDDMRQPLLSN